MSGSWWIGVSRDHGGPVCLTSKSLGVGARAPRDGRPHAGDGAPGLTGPLSRDARPSDPDTTSEGGHAGAGGAHTEPLFPFIADFRGGDRNQPFQLTTCRFSLESGLSPPGEVDLFGAGNGFRPALIAPWVITGRRSLLPHVPRLFQGSAQGRAPSDPVSGPRLGVRLATIPGEQEINLEGFAPWGIGTAANTSSRLSRRLSAVTRPSVRSSSLVSRSPSSLSGSGTKSRP